MLALGGEGDPVIEYRGRTWLGRGADQARMHKGTKKDKNKCML